MTTKTCPGLRLKVHACSRLTGVVIAVATNHGHRSREPRDRGRIQNAIQIPKIQMQGTNANGIEAMPRATLPGSRDVWPM